MKEYQLLAQSLDKATQSGAFTLQETQLIGQALAAVGQALADAEKAQEELAAKKAVESYNENPERKMTAQSTSKAAKK